MGKAKLCGLDKQLIDVTSLGESVSSTAAMPYWPHWRASMTPNEIAHLRADFLAFTEYMFQARKGVPMMRAKHQGPDLHRT